MEIQGDTIKKFKIWVTTLLYYVIKNGVLF